jgi:hypothetical protein
MKEEEGKLTGLGGRGSRRGRFDWVRLGATGCDWDRPELRQHKSVESVVHVRRVTVGDSDTTDKEGQPDCPLRPIPSYAINRFVHHHGRDITKTIKKRKTYRRFLGMIFLRGLKSTLMIETQWLAMPKFPKNRKNAKKSVKYSPRTPRFSAKTDVCEKKKCVSCSPCAACQRGCAYGSGTALQNCWTALGISVFVMLTDKLVKMFVETGDQPTRPVDVCAT